MRDNASCCASIGSPRRRRNVRSPDQFSHRFVGLCAVAAISEQPGRISLAAPPAPRREHNVNTASNPAATTAASKMRSSACPPTTSTACCAKTPTNSAATTRNGMFFLAPSRTPCYEHNMNNESNPTSAHPQAPAGGAEASRAFALAFAQILAPFVAHLAARLRWFRWLAPICPALARAIDQLERLVATLAAGDLPGSRHPQTTRSTNQPTPAAASEGHLPPQRAQPPAPPRQRPRILFARVPAAPPSTGPHIAPRPSARRPRAHIPATHRQHRAAARPQPRQPRCVAPANFFNGP